MDFFSVGRKFVSYNGLASQVFFVDDGRSWV